MKVPDPNISGIQNNGLIPESDKQPGPEPERFPLDDAAIALFAEYQSQIDQLGAAQRGMLTLFVRQHELKGNWQLAPGGRELIRREEEPAEGAQFAR